MSGFYELVGRLVVGFIRWRYGRQIRTAAAVGAGIALVAIGAHFASRENDDEQG